MSDELNPLVSDWIDKLSVEDAKALAQKVYGAQSPTIRDLPVKDLQSQLELSWSPAAAFLEPGTITADLFADGALGRPFSVSTDATVRTLGAGTNPPATVGSSVAVTLTVGSGQSVEIAVYFEAKAADVNSNWQVALHRDNALFLPTPVSDYRDWLGNNTAGYNSFGTLIYPTLSGINGGRAPYLLVPFLDTPSPGQHTYELKFGSTGNGGNIQNRKLMVRLA